MKKIIGVLFLILSLEAWAARKMVAPSLSWSSWYEFNSHITPTNFADGNSSNDCFVVQSAKITFTNVSNIDQEVEIEFGYNNLYTNTNTPGHKRFDIRLTGPISPVTCLAPSSASPCKSNSSIKSTKFIVPAQRSELKTFNAYYYFASADPITGARASNFLGTFEFTFNITQDKGALTALYESNFAPWLLCPGSTIGATLGSKMDHFITGNMQNTSKIILVNGGRPF